MRERIKQPSEAGIATFPNDSEPIKDEPLQRLEQIKGLVDLPEFLGTDGINHLIYDAFITKAQTFTDNDIHSREIESLWEASTATPEDITKIFQLAIGRGPHTNINRTSQDLVSKDLPTDQKKKLSEVIVKAGEWYALDYKLREWLKKKLYDFSTVNFILDENQEVGEFWNKQLRILNFSKGRAHSFSFCPYVITAAKAHESRTITAIQALGDNRRTRKRSTYDLVSAYLIGSLPFWNFTVIDNEADKRNLRTLRKQTLLETCQSGRPSTKTLKSISEGLENLEHAIPKRLKAVVTILEAENSAETPVAGLEPNLKG